MTAERWTSIKALYDAALEHRAGDREAFILAHAGDDRELCQEALAMVRNLSNDGGLLDISQFGRQLVHPALAGGALHPGTTLCGRYRIVRLIGTGGMGEVYEAEDIELGARVAVKTMRVEAADPLAQFKREIQLARNITHPGVCRIYDLHRHHEPSGASVVTFLTMELVQGETLTSYLARHGALTPADALPVVLQLADAMAAAHEKGVVHRDLKSGNVMLADDGRRVVVTDFGLAQRLTQVTEASVTIAGTPAYMAPEQFEGKPVTAAADIYAFGVLLFEMVTGRRPFAGSSPIALALEKLRSAPPRAGDIVPALPAVWSNVIQRMMDPRPTRRFSKVRDVVPLLIENADRKPLIRLSRGRKRLLAGLLTVCGCLGVGARLYTESVYVPQSEALRLYRAGAHAQQLGLYWKATQFYEKALVRDDRFIAARAALAEAWMDLDQPAKSATELQHAAALRPRWQRVASYEVFLEQAARARLRGDLRVSADLHARASAAAPASEKPDVMMDQAVSDVRAGNAAGAVQLYTDLEKSRTKCTAMMAHASLNLTDQPFPARRLLESSQACFDEAGDQDGVARATYGIAGRTGASSRSDLESARRALLISRNTGNVEQEILSWALESRFLLEMGEDDEAYAAFSRSMQVADQNGLKFLTARLLAERAQYYFDKGDFLQSDAVNGVALSISRGSAMPWTQAQCLLRVVRQNLRMGLPDAARRAISLIRDQLRQFPNAARSAQVTELENQAAQTQGRPELH